MQWLSTPHAPHPPPSLLWHQLNTESGHAEHFALSSSWYNFSRQASLVFLQFILHTLTLIDWVFSAYRYLTAADIVMNWIIILGILFYISFIYVCREQAPSSITVFKNIITRKKACTQCTYEWNLSVLVLVAFLAKSFTLTCLCFF